VDAEVHGRIHGFGEFAGGEFLHQLQRLLHRILLARSELRLPGLDALRGGHAQTPSTSTPMLRALPAMVRTAASPSAAGRSNCLQNSMMFTPCWPSAGPIGGEGLAEPAGTCSLM